MDSDRIEVTCQDCAFQKSFPNLARARLALEEHHSAGHAVDWQINQVSAGLKQAGADAGVCGRFGCGNPNSPLISYTAVDASLESAAQKNVKTDNDTAANRDGGPTESDHS